jgi:hypothetical protein
MNPGLESPAYHHRSLRDRGGAAAGWVIPNRVAMF